jgi:hypothetical protein
MYFRRSFGLQADNHRDTTQERTGEQYMSFQAYIDNIRTKTGKSPEDFRRLAENKGLFKSDLKAGDLVAWLKKDFDLGHGHSMAIWAVFKSKGWVKMPKKKNR